MSTTDGATYTYYHNMLILNGSEKTPMCGDLTEIENKIYSFCIIKKYVKTPLEMMICAPMKFRESLLLI